MDSNLYEQPENYVANIIINNKTITDISEEIVTSTNCDQSIAEPADKSVRTRKRKAKQEDWAVNVNKHNRLKRKVYNGKNWLMVNGIMK